MESKFECNLKKLFSSKGLLSRAVSSVSEARSFEMLSVRLEKVAWTRRSPIKMLVYRFVFYCKKEKR